LLSDFRSEASMSNLERVYHHFNREAGHYDTIAPKVIPHFHEQNALMVALVPFEREAPLSALDLGCGTGVLAQAVLAAFPKASVACFDMAENMLAACGAKLAACEGRFSLRQGNFATDDFGSGYDLIVSGLSIHHLDDAAKRALYRRVFDALKPGGAFLNRDVVLGATPELTERYAALWRAFMRSNGEDDEVWYGNAYREDIPATAEDQLAWLAEAGFTEVACHWRHLNFAIFGGRSSCPSSSRCRGHGGLAIL
jgi:tRNA (cmo5U34)-methyltransferase